MPFRYKKLLVPADLFFLSSYSRRVNVDDKSCTHISTMSLPFIRLEEIMKSEVWENVVCTRIPERKVTNRMHLYIEIYFKELALVVLKSG